MNFQATQLNFLFEAISSLIKPKAAPVELFDDSLTPKEIWIDLVRKHFQERVDLNSYKVVWSNRSQKRVLASCNIEKKIVRVAPAMRLAESQPYLEALIYHELCHAVVGIGIKNGRRDIHSKSFKELENQHPGIKLLDIWIKQGGWVNAVKKSNRLIKKKSLPFRPL